MNDFTDPARELAEVCDKLTESNGTIGGKFLATKFSVEPDSFEFFQIIYCIVERIDFLLSILSSIELDDDYREDAAKHLRELKKAFSNQSLASSWSSMGKKFVSKENIQPIKMLSAQVRAKISYPKLTDEQIQEHQLSEQDFIRQAIIEGLEHLQFRLSCLSWLGWGFSQKALKEVIGAYLLLHHTISHNQNSLPEANAVLMKVSSFLEKANSRIKWAKDVHGSAKFLLELYGGAHIIGDVTSAVAGLLTKQ
jgi:hypothetical protein